MTEENKFDVKKLQAMQVPLTVRAVGMRGETQMPLNIPPGSMSQNGAAGTGYTREEVMALEQALGKAFGGGHYEISVVDANQSDMKWRIMLDPSIYPGKNAQQSPPQMPMGNAPQPMQMPQVQPVSVAQTHQHQQQHPMAPPQPAPQQQMPGASLPPWAGLPTFPQIYNSQAQVPGYPNNPTWPGQPYTPPNMPPYWPPQPSYWPPPQPPQPAPNNSFEKDTMLRMELKEALTSQASAFKEEMRAVRDSLAVITTAAQHPPRQDLSGLTDLAKLAIPFLPQILGFLNNRQPKEDPTTNLLKDELRSMKETVQRQEERRAQEAERQQMLQNMEQMKGSMVRELESLKASVADKASSQQVGVLDRVIDAFKGINADKPVPQGLQLQDIVAILTMVKDTAGSGGKGTDLRDTLALFRELAETFGGGSGESPVLTQVINGLTGVTQQVIQAKAMQQMSSAPTRQAPVNYPSPSPIPAQITQGTDNLHGVVSQPAPAGLAAIIGKELTEAVQQLRAGAKLWLDSKGTQGLSPVSAAQRVKEAADRLMSLNFKTDLSTLFNEAKFGELGFELFRLKEGDYLQEFIETLEELTKMEAVDYGAVEDEEGEEGDGSEGEHPGDR